MILAEIQAQLAGQHLSLGEDTDVIVLAINTLAGNHLSHGERPT